MGRYLSDRLLRRISSSAVDLSNYVQKVAGKSLVSDTEIERLRNVTGSPTLTSEQLAAIAAQVDISGKVDKVTGSRLITSTEAGNIHASGSDNQDLSSYVLTDDNRLTNARTPTTHTHPNDHASGSDNQDLSGLVTNNDARLTNARTPTTHSHAASDITGTAVLTNDGRLDNARPASDVPTWAKAATKPSYNASEVGAEEANVNIQSHVSSAHAVSNAQKNSDITKAEIEAKLTGELTSHTHATSSPTWATGIATKNITDVSAVQNIPHGLGRVPKYVRIDGAVIITAAITQMCTGIFGGGNNSGLNIAIGEGTSTAATDAVYTSTTIALGFSPLVTTNPFTGANRQTGVITVDATNIIITWTKTGTIAGTASLIWQCT